MPLGFTTVTIVRQRAAWALGPTVMLALVVGGCNQQTTAPAPASSATGEVAAVTKGAPAEPVAPVIKLLPAPQTGTTVTGRALVVGKVPPAVTQAPGSDPYCARSPIPDEALLVDGQGGLRNVLVRVVEGVAGAYAPPSEPVLLTQSACRYRPRVLGIVRGQPVQVTNSDETLHNVHALLGQRTVLNLVQVNAAAPPIDLRPMLAAAKTNPLQLRCDVHPWMTAYLWVLDQPFFAVTAEDGTFSIKNLAAGEYVLEAWHEQLGTRRAKLSIPPSEAAAAKAAHAEFRFTLEKPAEKTGKAAPVAAPAARTGG